MKDFESLKRLDEDSTPEQAFDALKQLWPERAEQTYGTQWREDGYPQGLEATTKQRESYDVAPDHDITTTATAYVIRWHEDTFFGPRERSAMILNIEVGGLAPDGFYTQTRYAMEAPQDEAELDAALLLAERGNFPQKRYTEEG